MADTAENTQNTDISNEQVEAQQEPQSEVSATESLNTSETSNNPLSDVFEQVEPQNPEPSVVQNVAPETYDLKMSDGSELEKSDYDRLSSIFKEANVTQEQAQKILSAYENEVTQFNSQIEQSVNEQKSQWINDIQNDAELGGKNFETTKNNLKTVIQKFGDQSLADFLNKSSLGYNPDFVRFMNRIGATIKTEQNFVNSNNTVPSERERFARMYPKSPNLWKNL